MTDDLIERLRREAAAWDDWNEDHPDDAAVTTPPLLREAAAALEAAREDAERLDALDAMILESDERALLLHHGMHKRRKPSFCGLGLSNTGRTLRQAIDQARGKGVAGGA